MATEEEAITVTPGQLVTLQADVMRGHGTFVEEGQLYSSLAGRVVQVNKLVTVVAHKSRYVGEVGDIVVGRVKQVQQNQWLVDINAAQDSRLRLSAIHLPGGIQRRKLESDELEIRRFFIEDELVSAEIQAVHMDGSTSLHTRNIKYGKLNGGILLKVASGNIQRTKNHFYSAACGIDLIIGMNGLIWLGPHRPPFQAEDDQYVVPSLVLTLILRLLSCHVKHLGEHRNLPRRK